ncbi:G/T mismatch-specific thymine DNA glycosylase-like [Bombus vosnesenskii]|uniref:G/T mismatch-specific thymine DNA glycosylase n=1 Tax=Bombus vosnesenskii TaxID=207650 RepID=A0A6J3JWW1_9HYME|nr:G/T mismatch-specific thymine DNA glycosylase-like [Bombus vosnesenskii]
MVIILYRAMSSLTLSKLKKAPIGKIDKQRKKINRFDGLTEEEVQKYTLPDYLEMNLDIVFVGINPSLMAAHRGRYYAGPGNHFYKLLHESRLTSRCLSYEEDHKLLQFRIGLTNIVARATKSSADLKRTEIKEGSKIVEEKLKLYKPKIAVFNGKCIYEVFANKTDNFNFGLQPEKVDETAIWVTPSSSARCANFPRMTDKLHFFTSLKKYLQFLKGEIKDIDMKEFLFEGKCKQFIPQTSKMWRRKNMSTFLHGGRIANKDTICLDTSDENVAIAHSTEFIVKKLEPDKSDKTDEILDTDESDSSQNFEACISQDIVKTFFGNDGTSQKEQSLAVKNVKIKQPNNQAMTSDIKKSKRQTNRKEKKIVKKFPNKPVRSKDLENNTNDFINLIKQRLIGKLNNFDE